MMHENVLSCTVPSTLTLIMVCDAVHRTYFFRYTVSQSSPFFHRFIASQTFVNICLIEKQIKNTKTTFSADKNDMKSFGGCINFS